MYCEVRQRRPSRRRILEKGMTKKRVSRETGISRRKNKKMLTHEHPPSYGPRQRCYPKLRPYIDKINRLRHDATTSSPAANITIQDIVQILRREEGFAGSYDSVRNYIRHLTREDETAWERAYDLITRLPRPRAIDFVRLLSRGNLPVFTSAQIQLFTRETAYSRNPTTHPGREGQRRIDVEWMRRGRSEGGKRGTLPPGRCDIPQISGFLRHLRHARLLGLDPAMGAP